MPLDPRLQAMAGQSGAMQVDQIDPKSFREMYESGELATALGVEQPSDAPAANAVEPGAPLQIDNRL